jgi:YD repeat-containing protein
MLGQGWMVPLEYELEVKKETIVFHYRHGTRLEFEPIAIGDESILTKRGFRLIRTQAKAYQLILNSGTIMTFKEYAEDHYKITAIGDRHGNRLNLMFNQHKQISYIATADARLFELQYVSIEIEEEVETSKPKSKANQEQSVKNNKPKRRVQRLHRVIEHIYTKEKFTLSDQAQGKKEEQLIECEDQRLFYLGFINGQLHTIAAYPSKAKHELEEKSKLSIQKAAQEILVIYGYSQEGDLVEVKNQAGITKRLFEYTNHMMTAHKEPEGLESYYAYDQYEPTGKVTKSWSNRGEAWEFTYEDKKTTVTDHTGNEEYFIYDEDNYLLERGDAYSSITFEYTPKGLLSKLTDEVGRVKELRYNIWGQPTVIKEFNTVLTRIYYDKATQQPIKVRDGLDNVVRFEHDERGNLTKVIYPNQSETTYEYNQQGELMSVTNPLNGKSRYTYNSQGSLVSQTTPNGAVTTYHYDREGKITQKSNALGNSSYVIYDTQKRVQASIDAHQSKTEYFYDKTDRIIKTKDGINNEIHYQYNTQARLYRITDPVGNDTKYFYDNAGRFEQELSPSKELSVRSYNPDNTLNSITRRDNSEIVFTYNALRVPSEILYTSTHSDTQKTQTLRQSFGYDRVGRLTQASDAHSLVRLGYNRIGKINQEQQFFNAFTIQKTSEAKTHTDTLSFAETTVKVTNDFTTRTKTLTKNNRYPIVIHYDTQGIETKIVYPNGLEERYTFNPTYQLIAIETAYQRLSYQYDKVGNIVQKSGHTYRYDAIGRVIQANQHSFVYDKAGNNQNDYARYDQTTYQLLENQRYRFTYDRRGNLQTKTDKPKQEITYYRFNLLNQLTEVIIKDRDHRTIKTFRYEYDALNRRIMKQEDNQTNYYL